MLTKSIGVSAEARSTLLAIADRLEEKCAVLDAAQAAWSSPALPEDAKLRILVDVRRALVDAAAELESVSTR